jgi:hypothetical protein
MNTPCYIRRRRGYQDEHMSALTKDLFFFKDAIGNPRKLISFFM